MPSCLWCDIEKVTNRRLEPGAARECPICDHVFQGNGWDGIDAHWKAKHDPKIKSYEEFWPGVSDCKRHHR